MKLYIVNYPFQVFADSENDAIDKVELGLNEMSRVFIESVSDKHPDLKEKVQDLFKIYNANLDKQNVETPNKMPPLYPTAKKKMLN